MNPMEINLMHPEKSRAIWASPRVYPDDAANASNAACVNLDQSARIR